MATSSQNQKNKKNEPGYNDYSPYDFTKVIEPITGQRIDKSRPEANADRDWARRSFTYTRRDLDLFKADAAALQQAQKTKGFSHNNGARLTDAKHQKAWRSFVSTELGGNFPINTVYGYTPTADVYVDRLLPELGGQMGRAYQERIEDNAHDIHIRLGVQKFNSGISFFSNWFDYYSHTIAVHGRAPSLFYDIGVISGVAMGWMAPQVFLFGMLIKFFALLGGGRFWYVSPAMPLYWTAVTNIFNELSGSMGITTSTTAADAADMRFGKPGAVGQQNQTYIQKAASMLPGIFSDQNGTWDSGFNIDVRRVASRAQSTQNQINAAVQKRLVEMGEYDVSDAVKIYDESAKAILNQGKWGSKIQFKSDGRVPETSLKAYMQEYFKSDLGNNNKDEKLTGWKIEDKDRKSGDTKQDPGSMQALFSKKGQELTDTGTKNDDSVFTLLKKELNDGSAFVTLRVDGTRSVSESFSNSSEESQIASMINSWAETRKQINFNLAGGSLLGDVAGAVMTGAQDFVAGAAKSLGLSGLTGFMFGAKIDIPKTWGGASASLPKASYTMKLRTPYKHPLAIAQDLYLPMCMVLGMVLPLSQGRNAHGGPFYCEVYDRGRCVIKNGIVSSVSIERATSNVAWTADGFPLGIDINLEIENLETTVHMPINTLSLLDTINPIDAVDRIMNGNENAMADYITTLAALSLPDIIYRTNNIKRNWYAYKRQWSSYWDRDHFIQRFAASPVGKVWSWFETGTTRT